MLRSAIVFMLVHLVAGMSDGNKWCVDRMTSTVPNEPLIGTWYEVYRFAAGLVYPPLTSCTRHEITKPTPEKLQDYRNLYSSPDLPYVIEDDAVVVNRSYTRQMDIALLTGKKEAKFYMADPNEVYFAPTGYWIRGYRIINDDYALITNCPYGNTKTLISRIKNATKEERRKVIDTVDDIKKMDSQMMCAELCCGHGK